MTQNLTEVQNSVCFTVCVGLDAIDAHYFVARPRSRKGFFFRSSKPRLQVHSLKPPLSLKHLWQCSINDQIFWADHLPPSVLVNIPRKSRKAGQKLHAQRRDFDSYIRPSSPTSKHPEAPLSYSLPPSSHPDTSMSSSISSILSSALPPLPLNNYHKSEPPVAMHSVPH